MPVSHLTSTYHAPECEGDVLHVRDLHFAYPDGHAALNGVSLKLCAGDKAALVGPNGAGKSTLMLHLNGILQGRGEVQIAGMKLTRATLPVIRSMDSQEKKKIVKATRQVKRKKVIGKIIPENNRSIT